MGTSLESLLDYAHQCHTPTSSTMTVSIGIAIGMAPPKGGSPGLDLTNDPQGKCATQATLEGTGTSSNLRCHTREEMERLDVHHPQGLRHYLPGYNL